MCSKILHASQETCHLNCILLVMMMHRAYFNCLPVSSLLTLLFFHNIGVDPCVCLGKSSRALYFIGNVLVGYS